MVALPAMWLVNDDAQGDRSAAPNVAAVGVDAERAVGATPSTVDAGLLDPLAPAGGTLTPRFLAGPTAGPSRGPIVVVGPDVEGESVAMDATFRRSVGAVDACQVNRIPDGTLVSVVNLENGRSVECLTGPLDSGSFDEIVLHPDRFQLIADVTDAPVRVEIRW